MSNTPFTTYVRSAKGSAPTERGMYVRFDRTSSAQLVKLLELALARAPTVLLSGLEAPDAPELISRCEIVAPCVWKLTARPSEASAILEWGYLGNWCLLIGADPGKTLLPFEFRGVENVLDALFESMGASGGLVAFHDNTTIWAYVSNAA